jgi:multiple antibiotic resistance protein
MDMNILEALERLASESVKLFALLTPPVVLAAFLGATRNEDVPRKRAIARKTAIAVFVMGIVLYTCGNHIFAFFSFTLDAFRIGTGILLFLSSVALVNEHPRHDACPADEDISIVPLATPLCLGPASIGTLIVLGASATTLLDRVLGGLSLLAASAGIYLLLHFADPIGRRLGTAGLNVLSKLTGLLLAAIAAQVVFTGIRGIMG